MPSDKTGSDVGVVTRKKTRTQKPKMYRVILHNDDYTSMDFVIFVLETVFHKPPVEAARLMLQIHREGSGIAGVYSRDVAETKVKQVEDLAVDSGYPLLCTMELD